MSILKADILTFVKQALLETNFVQADVDEAIKAHGSEITWEVYHGESSFIVWARHTSDDENSFKYTAGWSDLDVAVEDVHRQIQKHGPDWAHAPRRQKT